MQLADERRLTATIVKRRLTTTIVKRSGEANVDSAVGDQATVADAAEPLAPPATGMHRPHNIRFTCFLVPTWCDNCNGPLFGVGFTCKRCGLRCHAGLGRGTEHCRGDVLRTHCQPGTCHRHRGDAYRFGDVAKQVFRDIHQAVKEVVVSKMIQEQRRFGKFDRLRQHVQTLQGFWDNTKVVCCFALLQLATVLLAVAPALLLPRLIVRTPYATTLSRVQAAWSAVVLVLCETAGLLLVRSVALALLRYSELIHCFILEVPKVNLEDEGIKLDVAATEALKVVHRALMFSFLLFVASLGVYVGLLLAL